MRILFFGSDLFAVPALQALTQSRHQIVAVITQPDKPAGRGQKKTPCPVATAAKEANHFLLQPERIKDSETLVTVSKMDFDILVVVAYGQFIPQLLIDSARFNAVNIHPSLLPKYRGAAPIQHAILNGDTVTGVTTLQIGDKMDAGNIYLQCETEIDETETSDMLHRRLSIVGADLILKTLEAIENREIVAMPQDDTQATMAPKIKKTEGQLDWNKKATQLYNRIKAFTPWPGSFCFLNEKRLKVLEAAPLEMPTDAEPGEVIEAKEGIIVACKQGALCLIEVQLEGKKPVSASNFLKGNKMSKGTKLT